MNPDIKARWVQALRSGEYKQGRRRLCRILPDGQKEWCCLGVLTDLAEKVGVIAPGVLIEDDDYATASASAVSPRPYIAWDDNGAVLPPAVREWADLTYSNPVVNRMTLAYWNDADELNFHQIADLIEEHL